MYRINMLSNNVEKLEQKLFKDLNIDERKHLQEWIAKNPEMLGEELLIIQKEYDGFNDTKERLDLLATDKSGGLVIIENKLDDSGRDVVWQALKYTSYCSTLTTNQIIKVYQEYLDKENRREDAKQNLLEFLEISEEELLLNRNDQRIFFVANHFRKEVTSTVLWLLKHSIDIKCFRAKPYSMGLDIFLQVELIIPIPETAEFMIDAHEKEKEENQKSKTIEESERNLVAFWTLLKERLAEKKLNYIENVNPKPHYSIGFWKGNGKFAYCIGKYNFRVELYFSNDPDKKFIDAMSKYKSEIESSFEGTLEWERLENKRASRIKFEMPSELHNNLDGRFKDKTNWDQIIDWYIFAMKDFYSKLNPYLNKIQ